MSDLPEVYLITGSSRGIGRELALRVARDGALVLVNYRINAEAAQATCRDIEALGGQAMPIQADVANQEDVERLGRWLTDEVGRLDAVVVNAAASAFKPLLEIKRHHVDKTMAITVAGTLQVVQAAVPLMREGGRIVAVSGWDSRRVVPKHGLLGAAKAALESLVRYLAAELADRGISVLGVCPGPVDTDSFRYYAGEDWSTYEREWLTRSPLRRFPVPADLSGLLRFCASHDALWLTGQTLVADGGLSLSTMSHGRGGTP